MALNSREPQSTEKSDGLAEAERRDYAHRRRLPCRGHHQGDGREARLCRRTPRLLDCLLRRAAGPTARNRQHRRFPGDPENGDKTRNRELANDAAHALMNHAVSPAIPEAALVPFSVPRSVAALATDIPAVFLPNPKAASASSTSSHPTSG